MTSFTVPNRPPRVLVVGHGAIPTGFARVIHSALDHLTGYELHHFSPYYRGPELHKPWPIYPNRLSADVYGLDQVVEHVEAIRPDVILFVDDLVVLRIHLERLRPLRDVLGFKVVAYIPSDDEPIHPGSIDAFADLDLAVAYNQTGLMALSNAASAAGFMDVPILIIPHGVDLTRFYPIRATKLKPWIPNRQAARRAFFKSDLHDNDFIILNANRNQPRKRIDLTIEGFALFAKNKPENVRIYLHMGATKTYADRLALAKRLGIEDRVLPSVHVPHHPNLSDSQLNLLYNSCDVGVNTSTAEGWGLVAFEHAATGAPQIMNGHGVREELWAGHALLMPTYPLMTPSGLVVARNTSAEDLQRALEELYQNPDLFAESALASFLRTQDPHLDWKRIADQWDDVFRKVLSDSICLKDDS